MKMRMVVLKLAVRLVMARRRRRRRRRKSSIAIHQFSIISSGMYPQLQLQRHVNLGGVVPVCLY